MPPHTQIELPASLEENRLPSSAMPVRRASRLSHVWDWISSPQASPKASPTASPKLSRRRSSLSRFSDYWDWAAGRKEAPASPASQRAMTPRRRGSLGKTHVADFCLNPAIRPSLSARAHPSTVSCSRPAGFMWDWGKGRDGTPPSSPTSSASSSPRSRRMSLSTRLWDWSSRNPKEEEEQDE